MCYHTLNTGLQFIVTEGDIKAARLPRTQEFSSQQIFRFIDLLNCNIITQVTIYTIITYMYPQYNCTNYCKRYGIPECTGYQIVLGQFTRGPDDDSKESKHVVRKWQSIINLLCFDGICISLLSLMKGPLVRHSTGNKRKGRVERKRRCRCGGPEGSSSCHRKSMSI